jgi:hypothetical protein
MFYGIGFVNVFLWVFVGEETIMSASTYTHLGLNRDTQEIFDTQRKSLPIGYVVVTG